jgi:hypothetical protein
MDSGMPGVRNSVAVIVMDKGQLLLLEHCVERRRPPDDTLLYWPQCIV